MLRRLLLPSACLAFLVCLGTGAGATPPLPPYTWELKPVSYSKGVEQTELEFSFKSCIDREEIRVTFIPIGDLTISSETTVKGPVSKDKPFTARLQVRIPDNDTSGIQIEIDLGDGDRPMGSKKYFITTGQSLVIATRDPALPPMYAPSGSVIQLDESKMPPRPIPPPDSAAIKERRRRTDSLNARLQQQLKEDIEAEERRRKQEEMRELEKTPLTDDEVQWIQVGDEMWGRKKGEYKFRPAREVNYPHLQERLEYIIENMAPDSGYEVILDLRDPEDLDYLKSMTIDLRPDEREGFYRCTVTRENLQHIVRRKIYWMAPRHPRPAGPARDGTAPPRNDSLSREKCQAGSPDTT